MDTFRGSGPAELPSSSGSSGGNRALPGRDYGGPAAALPSGRSGRVVDSTPASERSWDRQEDAVFVPSRVPAYNNANNFTRIADNPVVPGPRRAETEVVAGRQVHVIYRPSRGLEVRDN